MTESRQVLSCTKIKYKTRALLRVNLRGAFFRTKKYIPAVNFCKTENLILEESIMDKNYKPITSMKEVPEQLRKLRRQYLRYQQAEIIYSISHEKLFELANDAGAVYRIDTRLIFPVSLLRLQVLSLYCQSLRKAWNPLNRLVMYFVQMILKTTVRRKKYLI